jgi:pentatricopeptide repeat protein
MKGTWITNLKMQEGLWLEDQRNPPCVAADRVVLAPGTMQMKNFAWNKELTKYVKDGQPKKVIQLFQQMQQERMSPNEFTFVEVIKARAGLLAPEDGRNVHEQIIQSGCESNVFVGCSLVDMYMQK